MSISKQDVKKLGIGYRVLASFLSGVTMIGIAGIVMFGFDESITLSTVAMYAVPLFGLFVFGSISLTGYPPKFLYWMMEPADEDRDV